MQTVRPAPAAERLPPSVTVVRTSHDEEWVRWPVHWPGIWVGALTALAVALGFGLVATASGAHALGPGYRFTSWRDFGFASLALAVFGAFLSFAAGGWVAARIAGLRRSEPAMLHGAITFLVALPILLVLIGLGLGSFFGAWYTGLAGTPVWVGTPGAPAPGAPVPPLSREAAAAARNSALGALFTLLLGLMGSVVGGWMASGEPMTFTHYRTRQSVTGGPTVTTGEAPVAA